MKRLIVIIGVLILSIVLGGVSYGATATANLQVSANVVGVCNVSTTPVNFGNVQGAMWTEVQGQIAVNCSSGVPYYIALDAGLHLASGLRFIASGSYSVPYWLFKDAALSLQWGDSDYANTYPPGSSLAGTGSGSSQAYPIYGNLDSFVGIPASTVLTDTVTVTVHY